MREEILRRFRVIKEDSGTIGELHFFLVDDSGEFSLKKGDVQGEAQKIISDAFMDNAIRFFDNDDLHIINLSEADNRKDAIFRYDFENALPEFTYITRLQTVEEEDYYNFKHDDISNLKGYCITYIHDNMRVTFYKQHYAVFLLDKDTSFSLKFNRTDRIEVLEDDIFRLNKSFDFIIIDGTLYVKDIDKLEKNYKFHEIIKANAQRSIEAIREFGLIENIDSLTTEAEDVSFARKLIKVTQASPVLTEVDKPTLISFIKQYSDGMLLNQLKFNETEDAIILGSKKSKKTLLKVLNDDYLESKLTSHLYSSAAKDDVTPTIEV